MNDTAEGLAKIFLFAKLILSLQQKYGFLNSSNMSISAREQTELIK